ncbi:MAG: GatB/YqeY domain-containing protein [Candidatus Kapabacteria bacterium]|nr:GatB/YqeY domain-containing protein [Candidatus Kapabacteria bacterium]
MALEAKINEEIKTAMKSGEKLRLETLRSIRAAIIEFAKSGLNREMNEADELKMLNNIAKKRKDAITMYKDANRMELAEKESAELAVILEFLPAQLSEVEVRAIIMKIKEDSGSVDMKDMGKVMGPSMKALSGKADGGLVQSIVKEILGGN